MTPEELRDVIVASTSDDAVKLAAWNLYLCADKAQRHLADLQEHMQKRDAGAQRAVAALGRLIMETPQGRKTVPLDVVRDIWRDACHG